MKRERISYEVCALPDSTPKRRVKQEDRKILLYFGTRIESVRTYSKAKSLNDSSCIVQLNFGNIKQRRRKPMTISSSFLSFRTKSRHTLSCLRIASKHAWKKRTDWTTGAWWCSPDSGVLRQRSSAWILMVSMKEYSESSVKRQGTWTIFSVLRFSSFLSSSILFTCLTLKVALLFSRERRRPSKYTIIEYTVSREVSLLTWFTSFRSVSSSSWLFCLRFGCIALRRNMMSLHANPLLASVDCLLHYSSCRSFFSFKTIIHSLLWLVFRERVTLTRLPSYTFSASCTLIVT